MGKQKHLNAVEKLFEKSHVVDFSSIARIIKNRSYAKLLVSNLLKKGKIKKLGKGCYTIHNEVSLSVFCFRPAYLGLQSALSYHGLWEQETIPVILTSKKTRVGMRKSIGSNILVRHISKKFFFGVEYLKDGSFYLPYSDIEKTLIDMVVFRQNISKDVLQRIRAKINRKKLARYLKPYSKRIRMKVDRLLQQNWFNSSSD